MEKAERMARAARDRIGQRQLSWELADFADSFPALLETHGLAQAVAVAKATGHRQYLEDLAGVLAAAGHAKAASADRLERATLEHSVTEYVQLSCNTLQAAACLRQSVVDAIVCQRAPAEPSSRAESPSRPT